MTNKVEGNISQVMGIKWVQEHPQHPTEWLKYFSVLLRYSLKALWPLADFLEIFARNCRCQLCSSLWATIQMQYRWFSKKVVTKNVKWEHLIVTSWFSLVLCKWFVNCETVSVILTNNFHQKVNFVDSKLFFSGDIQKNRWKLLQNVYRTTIYFLHLQKEFKVNLSFWVVSCQLQ